MPAAPPPTITTRFFPFLRRPSDDIVNAQRNVDLVVHKNKVMNQVPREGELEELNNERRRGELFMHGVRAWLASQWRRCTLRR